MAEPNPVELAAKIVAALSAFNPLPRGELPGLIQALHSTVDRLVNEPAGMPSKVQTKVPAVADHQNGSPRII